MTLPLLIHLPYSPWSEKARWALDHHRVLHRKQVYKPMVGEPLLRAKLGRFSGKVSVPVLIDGARIFDDSFAIAEHAERVGRGASLFPPALRDEIRAWNDIGERALASARAASLARAAKHPLALEEGLEGVVPKPLRPHLRGVARSAVAFLVRKYESERGDPRAMKSALDALRRALEVNGGTVLREPTYADYAMAVVLQFVTPVADAYLPIGEGTRAVFTDPALATAYADLVAWRDALYRDRRRA